MQFSKSFWRQKYDKKDMGWDLGHISKPLKSYIDQLTNKKLRILIPGAGLGYEAQYLFEHGFENTTVLDITKPPLVHLKQRVPEFPETHMINGDFFKHDGVYDLILEQTFFCALAPKLREDYVDKMHSLLGPKGKLVGLLFNVPLFSERPPFGGDLVEYQELFRYKFDLEIMGSSYNSDPSRVDKELFIKLIKK